MGVNAWMRMALETDKPEDPIFVDLYVPVVIPLSCYHTAAQGIPNGTRVKVFAGPLQGTVWVKEGAHSGYIVGDYEPKIQNAIVNAVGKEDVFWDLGGHYGFHSFLAAKCGVRKVITFEPRPENIDMIEQVLTLNPWAKERIQLFQGAIGKEYGRVSFHYVEGDTMWSKVSTAKGHPEWHDQPFKVMDGIEQFTVDGLIEAGYDRPNVLKIDVEGAESDVLLGGEQFFQKYKPTMILSVHGTRQLVACVEILGKFGYKESQIDTITKDDVLLIHGKDRHVVMDNAVS